MSYYCDTEKVEKAREALQTLKEIEGSTQLYVWKRGSVEIAYNSIGNLKKAVQTLGDEWETGTVKSTSK